MSKLPTLTMGATNIPLNSIINFMTLVKVDVLKNNHRELDIEQDETINRRLTIWLRQKRGLYTKPTHKEIDIKGSDDRKGDGIFCPTCMKHKHNEHYRNAQDQFEG